MFCAISGEVPSEPVVSKTSGHLFEKRLIEKFLESEDKCPVTGEPLTKEDLVSLQASQAARPRPITATSIPGLLSHFQNEWDAVMLETFTLKQHLDATRKELSQVLYQHDAACRVIARLTRERDEARAMLTQRQGMVAESRAAAAAGESMELDTSERPALTDITEAVVAQMAAKGKELSKWRKKRSISESLAKPDDIRSYSCKTSATPHSTSKPGVTAVDIHPSRSDVTLSGGADKQAIVYDHSQSKVVGTLSGHTKKITTVKFHPDASKGVALTGSADKTVKIWSASDSALNFAEKGAIAAHKGDVTGVTVHPTGDYFATSSKDASWCFCSLEYGNSLKQISKPELTSGFTCAQFHPDGLILGIGDEANAVRMWDVKTQNLIHSFDGHGGAVTSVDFSENGYFMASVAADGTARLWDLRKLKNIKTLDLASPGHVVKFDQSGTYLAIGSGKDLVVSAVKEWDTLATLSGHSKDVTCAVFGPDAKSIISSSMDRSVKVWGQ